MTAPRYRAWRFLHPDHDAASEPAGLGLSATGAIGMVEEAASVRQAILLLLSTTPGERVMRPDYGCDLRQFVFAPNDPTTHGLAIHAVRRALGRWESRLDLLKTDARQSDTDPDAMIIVIEYRLRRTLATDSLSYTFDLAAGQS